MLPGGSAKSGSREKRPRPVRSRFQPKAMAGLRLEERDRELLCDLFWQRAMSRSQLQRLYFTSLVRANARLRLLFDHGFVARYFLPAAPYGAQAVYEVAQSAPLLAAGMNGLEEGTDSMSVSSSEVLEVGGGSMPPSTSCRGR